MINIFVEFCVGTSPPIRAMCFKQFLAKQSEGSLILSTFHSLNFFLRNYFLLSKRKNKYQTIGSINIGANNKHTHRLKKKTICSGQKKIPNLFSKNNSKQKTYLIRIR